MIIGIDPSLSGTAVAIGDGTVWDVRRFSSTKLGDRPVDRIKRIRGLVNDVMVYIRNHAATPITGRRPDTIFIEGYSFASKDSLACFSAEYGGVLRLYLAELTDSIYEVAPNTLKKFVTGKGVGKKDAVIAHATKRWDVLFDSSDEYDAFALLQLGLTARGKRAADNQAQRDAVEAVLRPIKAKKRRRAAATDVLQT